MGGKTGISWTGSTWNPLRGCSKVSAGCTFCYAERMAARFGHPGEAYDGTIAYTAVSSSGNATGKTSAGLGDIAASMRGHWNGQIKLVPEALKIPLQWQRPRKIFVNSMSDLFHESVPDEYIAAVFGVMASAHWHTFQVLTKRPERMVRWFADHDLAAAKRHRSAATACLEAAYDRHHILVDDDHHRDWPLPNVHLGVSVEGQHVANERIPLLLQTPAAVRFISAEPLLGAVDIATWLSRRECACDARGDVSPFRPCTEPVACGQRLDWVIVGGESGPRARPCDVAWIEGVVQQCAAANVPAFVKQLGQVPVVADERWRHRRENEGWCGHLLNHSNRNRVREGTVPLKFASLKGDTIEEWPKHLQVQQFPNEVARG